MMEAQLPKKIYQSRPSLIMNVGNEYMTFMMMRAKNALKTELSPQAFNIGINEGFAAGQTVAHINMHLIPHFKGDVTEPRGGIRWIFPDKAVFWEKKPATVTTTETK